MRSAGAQRTVVAPVATHQFPQPTALGALTMRTGVMAHIFYPELIDEFAQALAHMPVRYTLLVSVVDESARRLVEQRFAPLPMLDRLDVRIVPNRGRDIAPMLVTFGEAIAELDLVAHIHTKKSLYTGGEQERWRRYLLDALLGSPSRIAWILGMFDAAPELGIVYPESFTGMPLWGHTWLSNAEAGEQLGQRMGVSIERAAYLDFPMGSMFWARVDALRPLLDLELRLEEFPPEQGQTDGTLHHAIERMLVVSARSSGHLAGILPVNGTLSMHTEGERNWRSLLEMPLATRLQVSALDTDLVSVDVFDTLALRPFLTPQGARAWISDLAAQRLGVMDFVDLRERAEDKARARLGRDPDLNAIYHAMAGFARGDLPTDALMSLELASEQRMLRPRGGMLQALSGLHGQPIIALSDMYLRADQLRQLLPPEVATLPSAWYVSCESGLRKDGPYLWPELARRENVATARWLHVGDNEHSDVQMPQRHGLATPVHVLRPSALLEVVPALRPLRAAEGASASWPEQLWRGLLANRFTDLFDHDPQPWADRPRLGAEDAGYVVLGPLLIDYLIWLRDIAEERGARILFLSREGFLLEQAYQRLARHDGAFSRIETRYFLASRRGTGMPTLQSEADLSRLLAGNFTGELCDLLRARLGGAAEIATASALSTSMRKQVYLPEMRDEVVALLQPALPALFTIATSERRSYLRYWHESVGDAKALVADLGYSGTIQRNLALLTDHEVDGAYFALTRAAEKLDGHGWALARHHDGRDASAVNSSAILDHDLLLEALLGAPQGQFAHFENTTPIFGPQELTEQGLAVMRSVHDGALAFIDDFAAIAGEQTSTLRLEPSQVTQPLKCLGSGQWDGAAWLGQLAVEDAYSGRGRVAAAPHPQH
ncbi:MAG TPA: rhamnan synthesis F family protein [Stenotrophomonas sp.]|jgi:FMN phosphatase YigB (HAD superfamily)